MGEKDAQLAGVVLRIVSNFANGHAPPPGFEQSNSADSPGVQAEAATGVQLAEQALEEPASSAPTSHAPADATALDPAQPVGTAGELHPEQGALLHSVGLTAVYSQMLSRPSNSGC